MSNLNRSLWIAALVGGALLGASLDAEARRQGQRSFSDKPRLAIAGGAMAAVTATVLAAHGAPDADPHELSLAAGDGEPSRYRSGEYTGVVTHVSDGDTLWVSMPAGSRPVKVRLEGIDAPEICQPWGTEARDALRERLKQHAVTVRVRARDSYGRYLARIFDATEDVGERMVKDGHAWSLRYRHDKGPYIGGERMAKFLGRGLHASPGAVMPRDFRRSHGTCHPELASSKQAAPTTK